MLRRHLPACGSPSRRLERGAFGLLTGDTRPSQTLIKLRRAR